MKAYKTPGISLTVEQIIFKMCYNIYVEVEMKLTIETCMRLTEIQANIVGHLGYAAFKLCYVQ